MKNIRITLLYFIAFLGIGVGLQAAQISLASAYLNAQNRVNGLSIQMDRETIMHSIMEEINQVLITVADDNSMIDEQHANTIINDILQKNGFAAKSKSTVALPRELQDKNIVHLVSASQTSEQYGAYAACNLLAIQELERSKEAICVPTIQNLFNQYIAQWINQLNQHKRQNSPVPVENAEFQDLFIIGEQMKLDNTYFLRYNNGTIESAGMLNTQGENIQNMFQLVRLLDSYKTVRFIYYTGRGYVAASIRKVNGIVRMLYLDSTNTPLENDDRARAFVNYLYNNTR